MQRITTLQLMYLLFAVAGLVIPWYYNIQQILQTGQVFTLNDYFRAGFSSPLTSSITADFFIGTIPVLIWMYVEGKQLGIKRMWLFVLLSFIIAFAFTCPLFLYFRDRKLHQPKTSFKTIV